MQGTKNKVLIVDDEANICELIRLYVEKEGYNAIIATDGAKAVEKFMQEKPDMVLLDIMLPVKDGWQVCREIRAVNDTPIIMLTAKGESKDKLRGFSSGVDDYVVKPFDPNELMARVKAIMKRYDINTSHIVRLNEVELDGDKYEIRYKDECIHLPLKQFELLFELAKHPNQIFSREQLIEKIWGMDYDGFDRTVDVHIKRIRENIGHLPGFNVVTVRGLGYKVEVE